MMRSLRSAAFVLALAACTPMQWVKEGGAVPPPEALEQDGASCRQQAWREAQYRSFAYRPIGPFYARGPVAPFGRGFFGWPYGPYTYPFGDPYFDEARLTDFCMRAKGYELVPVEKAKAPEG